MTNGYLVYDFMKIINKLRDVNTDVKVSRVWIVSKVCL